MMSRGDRTGGLRAITAVIALYALVLQAFLGGLMPVPALGHAGPICAGLADSPAGGETPAKPDHGAHKLCCTAVGAVAGTDHPVLAAADIVWPERIAALVAWRDAAWVAARGPPGSIAHPRGPPTV